MSDNLNSSSYTKTIGGVKLSITVVESPKKIPPAISPSPKKSFLKKLAK